MAPLPKRCCGGRLSLRTGVFLLAVLGALRGAIVLVATTALARDPSQLVPRPLLGDDAEDDAAADAVDTDADAVYTLRAIFAILAVCSLCQMVGGYLLVYGSLQEKPTFLTCWLICAAVTEPLAIAVAVPASTALAALGLWAAGIGALAAALGSAALTAYTGIMVYALYRQVTVICPGTEMLEQLTAAVAPEEESK